jgi:hypothetical protein
MFLADLPQAKKYYPNTLELASGVTKMPLRDNLRAWKTVTARKLAGPSPHVVFTAARTWGDKALGYKGYDSVELDEKTVSAGGHVLVELKLSKSRLMFQQSQILTLYS